MTADLLKASTTKALLAGLIGVAAGTSVCAANEYDGGRTTRPLQTVTVGQGGYYRLPDLRPAEPTYALTGQRSDYEETLRAWQRSVGPRYRIGNADVYVPPTPSR